MIYARLARISRFITAWGRDWSSSPCISWCSMTSTFRKKIPSWARFFRSLQQNCRFEHLTAAVPTVRISLTKSTLHVVVPLKLWLNVSENSSTFAVWVGLRVVHKLQSSISSCFWISKETTTAEPSSAWTSERRKEMAFCYLSSHEPHYHKKSALISMMDVCIDTCGEAKIFWMRDVSEAHRRAELDSKKVHSAEFAPHHKFQI